MIWHIFKKDWKLQWKFAVMMALVQFANAALLVKLGPFQDNRSLRSLLPLMILATIAGIPFLIAAVVHQDAIPGVRQDWLVRPIRRRDLLLAKFLFVLMAVHGPMLLADLFRGLANGFALGPSLAAAASRGLFVLLAFSVPLFAFASLTRNFMEAIVAGLIVFLCFVGFLFLVDQIASRHSLVIASGLSWISETAHYLVFLAGAMAAQLEFVEQMRSVNPLSAEYLEARGMMFQQRWYEAASRLDRLRPGRRDERTSRRVERSASRDWQDGSSRARRSAGPAPRRRPPGKRGRRPCRRWRSPPTFRFAD